MDFEEKTISRQDIFKGKIIDVKLDEVELPNGLGIGKRELVFHPGGVGVIAITAENKIVLVRQFRKPIEKVIYEVPAGKLEAGEKADLRAAILRELEEETGYSSQKIEQVSEFFVSPGFTNEKTYLFFTDELKKVPHPRAADADEVLEIHEVTLDEAKALVKSGEIDDAKTIIALQYWELLQLQKKNAGSINQWQFGR
ncbi:MAG: NUDIX hydrolase [Streptococcaceae bacterium]|jgi:ADP-ribose pyrophosphatase|nr:NUDIX hydrolase [Streptococcaceae bacterium]